MQISVEDSLQNHREQYQGGEKGGCQERVGGGSVCWVMRLDVILSAMVNEVYSTASAFWSRKFPHHKMTGGGGGGGGG
jgi:hypothetical protein